MPSSNMKPDPRKKTMGPIKKDPVIKLVQDVTNRYRVTAREARDIITAAGTFFNASNAKQNSASNKNLAKQVVETGKAAITGKKGTTSDTATIKKFKKEPNVYTKGTQRK